MKIPAFFNSQKEYQTFIKCWESIRPRDVVTVKINHWYYDILIFGIQAYIQNDNQIKIIRSSAKGITSRLLAGILLNTDDFSYIKHNTESQWFGTYRDVYSNVSGPDSNSGVLTHTDLG